ncbi:MAG TPA: MFS transporter [Streptosporangiaceae bacterium]|nr:MFS transporter [Streptosporangiaceae bacterium]
MTAIPRELRVSRAAVWIHFAILGTGTSTWAARLPALKATLHLSDGRLGLALFAAPCGSVLTLVLSGRLTDRFGAVRVLRVAGLMVPVALVTIGFARNLATLMLTLMLYGAVGGLLDVSMNACGARIEAAYGRPILSSLHGGYSIAGLLGAGAGGIFAALSVGPLPDFAIMAAILAVSACLTGRLVVLPPIVPRVVAPGEEEHGAARSVALVMIILGVLALCGQLGEGAANDWSAVYLHVDLGATPGVAAAGLAAFSVTMAVGRVAGDRLAQRFGQVPLVRVSGLVAGIGLGGALLVHSAPVAIAGFALLGFGLAALFPQVVSAVARLDPERAGHNIGRISAVSYLGLLGGPVVIGGVASGIGLRDALLIPAALAFLAALLAGAMRPADAESRDAERKRIRSARV